MTTKGIFIQQVFPVGAFGPGQWSNADMRRLFSWLKSLGYTSVVMMPWPIHRREQPGLTLLEQGSLFHSCLSEPPPFDPGFFYYPSDRYLGTPQALDQAQRFRDQVRLARDAGLKPWLGIGMTLGAPQFAQDHPELAAVGGSELFLEGTGLCPSAPAAMNHLLEFHGNQIQYLDAIEGYILWPRDPGGCACKRCLPQAQMMTRVANRFHKMIRAIRPAAPVSFMSWHVMLGEVPELAANLARDIEIFEAPRIHAMDVPLEAFTARVSEWQSRGRHVEGWIEVQENPTTLLPTVYPRRIDAMVRTMRSLKLQGVWATSTQNPYLFPLNFWMLPQLWDGSATAENLTREFLARSYGSDAVEAALRWVDLTERTWDKVQSASQWAAGFIGLFVFTFPSRMLPQRAMRNGVPAETRADLTQGVELARQALSAAEALADRIRTPHAADANMIVSSAEVLCRRVEMRWAKLAVLDALHAGDAAKAALAWPAVAQACQQMVDAAHGAPNTDTLAKHWRRLDLLPARLRTLAMHLPELAEKKSYRSVQQPLYMSEIYDDSGHENGNGNGNGR